MQSIEEELTPFGFINSGVEDEIEVDGSGQTWHIERENSNSDFL
jgi:hypothetical protein